MEATKFFYCNVDSYGQRTGTYQEVFLLPSEIELNRFGMETYNGFYLYSSEYQVLLACQD
jgi:hypothetical protein